MNERTKQMIISLLEQADLDGEERVHVRDNRFPRREDGTTFRVVTADGHLHSITLPKSLQLAMEERTIRILTDLSDDTPEDVIKAKGVAGNFGCEYREALEKRIQELEARIATGSRDDGPASSKEAPYG